MNYFKINYYIFLVWMTSLRNNPSAKEHFDVYENVIYILANSVKPQQLPNISDTSESSGNTLQIQLAAG